MATITVTSTVDTGLGSLRAAIANAQSGDTIQFDASLTNQTITLTTGQLEINKNLIIDGTNAPGITISGNNTSRVFHITLAPDYTPTNVTLRGLTIADGNASGAVQDGAGGGVLTDGGTLTVENSQFKNNQANGDGGGAIFAGYQSTNTIINSTFDGNSTLGNSERGGGAIAVNAKSSITITGSQFTNNQGVNGGAINTVLTGLTIENSTFTNNKSTGYGGAVYTDGASAKADGSTSGKIEINNSRFDGNTGAGQGGGLFLFVYSADQATVENSTIINNQLMADAKGDSLGGGLRFGVGELTLSNTTLANNRALEQGGGLWVGETSALTVDNSTFYGNRAESTDGKNGLGGAIALVNGSSPNKISNSTIADNYAGFMGGGFFAGGPSTILTNTLVADNFANNGGNPWNINHQTTATFTDGGGNVQSLNPNPNDTKITAGVTLIDPQLGAFIDNGSAVQTPPLPGNPDVLAGAVPSGDSPVSSPLDPDEGNGILTLSKTPDDIFQIQGNSGLAQLQFSLTSRQTTYVNEVGAFLVDDSSGTVNGIAPGQPGYLQAALSRSQVIFSALPGNQFPDLRTTRQLSFDAGQDIGFYLVQNSTTTTVLSDLAAGRTPANVFFATSSANPDNFDHLQVSQLSDGSFNLGWEDSLGGGNADFKELALTVKQVTDPQMLGTKLQGGQEKEVIDLRDQLTGLVPAQFVVNRSAAYHDSFGFYAIDDPTGRIGNLNPGDPGYAQAAVSQRLDLTVGLPGGKILAPFLIANGTPEEFLAKNPNNQPGQGKLAYFPYLGANPDQVDHLRLFGDNVFGFEDLFGGGDRDYNDLLVQVNLSQAGVS